MRPVGAHADERFLGQVLGERAVTDVETERADEAGPLHSAEVGELRVVGHTRKTHATPDRFQSTELSRVWPSYEAYAISFLIIGIIWVNHHGMYRLMGRVDRTMLFVNLGLLGTVALLPFTTAPVYGASIGLAFVNATACLVVYALVAAYFTVSYVTSDETSVATAPTASRSGSRT